MDKIVYCVPTYRSFDLCEESVDAVMAGSLKPDKIFILDDSGTDVGATLQNNLLEKYPQQVTFVAAHERRGVAKSWNSFFTFTDDDYLVIANDDIKVHKYSLEHIINAEKQYHYSFICGDHASGNAFSLFLLRRDLWAKLGGFDEQFFPAYFEDNDFFRRMQLIEHAIHTVPEASYDHVGSSTLKRYTADETLQHHSQFRANRDYYYRKWGGLPGEEVYTAPFNGKI